MFILSVNYCVCFLVCHACTLACHEFDLACAHVRSPYSRACMSLSLCRRNGQFLSMHLLDISVMGHSPLRRLAQANFVRVTHPDSHPTLRAIRFIYDPQTAGVETSAMSRILNPEQAGTIVKLASKIQKWEERSRDYIDKVGESPINERTRKELLVQMCPDKFQEHIRDLLLINKGATWQQVRELIFTKVQVYLGSKAAAESTKMEVGMFDSDEDLEKAKDSLEDDGDWHGWQGDDDGDGVPPDSYGGAPKGVGTGKGLTDKNGKTGTKGKDVKAAKQRYTKGRF